MSIACREDVTLKRLKELLHYNPETGLFIWKVWRPNGPKPGDVAGTTGSKGYWRLKIDGVSYAAHRVAWFYMTGEWPKDQIDHKNRIRNDNRWSNLREATPKQNSENAGLRTSKRTGHKGIRPYGHKFMVHDKINGVMTYIGTFDNLELAIAAKENFLYKPLGLFSGTLSFGA